MRDEFLGTFPWGSITQLGTAQYPSDYAFYRGPENRLLQKSNVGQMGTLRQDAQAATVDLAGRRVFIASGLNVLEIDSEGTEVGSLQVRPPAAGERTLDGYPIKAQPTPGIVSALAVGPDGIVYAFASNGVNSMLQSLSDGRRLDLRGYGTVNDVTVTADGTAYAILLDDSKTGNHFTLAVVALKDMSLVGTVDTGIAPGNGSIEGSINGLRVLATQSGEVFVFANKSIDESKQQTTLLHLDSDLSLSAVPLPNNYGLQATVGVDGRIYMYGGLAAENVYTFHPETGSLEMVADAAPKGTYVQAVFTN